MQFALMYKRMWVRSVAVEGGPVYSSSSPRRCWRPHVTHTCIRPNLTFYSRVRRLHKGARQQDSKSNHNPNLHSVSGQAVTVIAHRSQYDNGFSSLSSEGGTEKHQVGRPVYHGYRAHTRRLDPGGILVYRDPRSYQPAPSVLE